VQRKVPNVLSLTDFMGWRYGYVAKSYVVLLCLFNMSIGEPPGGQQPGRSNSSSGELAPSVTPAAAE
jgi:hypothetical protein